MAEPSETHAMALERSCSVTAVALSEQRREGVRLVTGDRRGFGLNAALTFVHVPYPAPDLSKPDWTRRTLTCGVALQCSPSKERITEYRLNELSARELRALTLVEAGVALGWIASRWPGLLPEVQRLLPEVHAEAGDMDAAEMLNRAIALATTGQALTVHPLLGHLPLAYTAPHGLTDKLRRSFGRMPWTSTQKRLPRPYSVPVGGDGGVRNPNLPPPSRPQDNDFDVTPEHRPGIPYPEWNMWTKQFMHDHVAVIEHADGRRIRRPVPVAVDVRKWFEEHTHRAMTNRLEDGSDLDVDQYVNHYIDLSTGEAKEPRLFRDLLPSSRDVATALLLDGSSSLGVHGGRVFQLELACADALSRAMTLARERHGVFVFTGNTRHRVEVRCLKDFDDRRFVPPSGLGLSTRRIHATRCATAPFDEPAPGSALRAAPADRHRRRSHLRRGLRGPLRLGGRRARRRGGERRRCVDVLRRRRTDPGRSPSRGVRAPTVATDPTRRGAPEGVGSRPP